MSSRILSLAGRSPVGQGLFIIEASRSSSDTHIRLESSGRMMGPSQRPLPDNTQGPQQTSMTPEGFEPTTPASDRQHTYAVGSAATGNGNPILLTGLGLSGLKRSEGECDF